MNIDAKFELDAHKVLESLIEQDLLPPVNHWIWLEPDQVRLYRFEDCVEFQTAHQTLQIELLKHEVHL